MLVRGDGSILVLLLLVLHFTFLLVRLLTRLAFRLVFSNLLFHFSLHKPVVGRGKDLVYIRFEEFELRVMVPG